jgi:hypothetical protein
MSVEQLSRASYVNDDDGGDNDDVVVVFVAVAAVTIIIIKQVQVNKFECLLPKYLVT